MPIKKYPNRTSDRIVGPEIVSSLKGGVQVAARHQVNKQCSSYAFMSIWEPFSRHGQSILLTLPFQNETHYFQCSWTWECSTELAF